MVTIFIIGGMGAGKSTVREALASQGLPCIDFDCIGHEALAQADVKAALSKAFGTDIIDAHGNVARSLLAERAFASPAATRQLNAITLPQIEDAFKRQLAMLEAAGCPAVVAEASNFQGRSGWLVREDDLVVAVIAPAKARIARAIAAGWPEDDVRQRIARQPSDAACIAEADVVFRNDGTAEQLRDAVIAWWQAERAKIERPTE